MVLGKPGDSFAPEEVFVFPASFAQQRLWFIEQLAPGSSLYTIPLVFRLTGTLHVKALEQSLQALISRHEILRTTFELVQGKLVQAISPELPLTLTPTVLTDLPADRRDEAAREQIRQESERPFDLSRGPLLRARLWQLDRTSHLLLIALHHIIFDEWSSGVFIRELGALYAAFVSGRPANLPELPIQYADFAHWQRQWLQGEVLHQQLGYWRQQLKDLPDLILPTTFSRPREQHHRGASQLLELPQELLQGLEELSQRAGVTLFMTLLAAFQVLLHRYSGQEDVVVGSPIANRHRSELEGLIGFLVNSLVLRTDLSGNPTFLQLLERVRQTTLDAYAHQDVPFEKLVETLQPARNLSQNPLFQVVFALQNAPMDQLDLPGVTLSPVEFETQTTRFDLELYLWKCTGDFRSLWGQGWQQNDGLRGVVVYNTDLFSEDAIASLRQHFHTLLEGIVARPESHLSELPLLTTAEQQQLASWNQTHTNYPAHACIHHLFEQQVRRRPTATALRFGHQQFTYRMLNHGSNQLARYLQRQGVKPQTPVGICLGQTADAIAAMLAVLKAGAFYVPLDPSHPPERLRSLLEDAQVTVVLTRQALEAGLPSTKASIICLDQAWPEIAQESELDLPIAGAADQLAYVMYTSGSTGTPKGVMVPHRAVNRLVLKTNYVQIGPGDRVAQVANLAFDAATFEIWGALLNGAQLISIDRQTALSPVEFTAAVQRHRISVMFLTTALVNQIASEVPTGLRSLRALLFGGEAVSPDRVRTILERGKPQHLIHVYGPTENTTFSTWHEVLEVPPEATTVPIGKPIANTQVHLLDAYQNPVPVGVSGEIYLSGEGLANGYLNRPDLSAESFLSLSLGPESDLGPSFPTRLYKTGDRARYRADGSLEFLGRADNQVKIRGFRIEPGEVEAVLSQHPGVQASVVTVRHHEADRQLIAYVVPRPSGQAPATWDESDLREFLKSRLPAYMLPAALIPVAALPLTANGKVDVRSLPDPSLALERTVAPAALPRTALEQALANLWCQLLGCQQVSIHDSFFDLGGHSLLATQLVSRIRDTLHIEVPLRALFESPTIAALAQHLEGLQRPNGAAHSADYSSAWVAEHVEQAGRASPTLEAALLPREEIEL
ncbi:MAG TPA: amino acid adenylation domain-containing protein [Trichocoleus sp.]